MSLLTFNAVSPTIFLNSERYLLAVQNGFAQAAQSWDAASGTYLPPSNGTDLSWKQTISLGWQKRQAILNKVKNPKVETFEDKLSKMSRAELEEEYGDVIQAYKRFTNMGQGDTILAKWDMNDLKLLWKRYNEVKDDHLGLLPSELAKVDPKFKKRIDAMDQEALEEAYPELKTLISMAHVNPYAQLFKSETERANDHYLLDRYFLLDSQKMLSWRDPAFQTKYDYYIIEEGIDPFTGKPATQEEINRAKDIKKVRAFTESLQLASTLYTSYVGYNQYYNKPYTTFSDVFSKVKGKIPVFNRKPVIPEVNTNVETNVKTKTETTKIYDREHILRNIEESRLARESSKFDDYLRKEYAQQGKYFAERISWENGKYAYLSKDIDSATGKPTPVRYRSYLKADGSIDWPLEDGFVLDSAGNPVTQPANLKAGQVIDRFGNSFGRFTSPVDNGEKLAFNTRGLPYPEGYQAYHQYEIVKDINLENIKNGYKLLSEKDKIVLTKLMKDRHFTLEDMANPQKGQIAKIFGQGGGTQIQFGTSVVWYEKMGLLKEVVK